MLGGSAGKANDAHTELDTAKPSVGHAPRNFRSKEKQIDLPAAEEASGDLVFADRESRTFRIGDVREGAADNSTGPESQHAEKS